MNNVRLASIGGLWMMLALQTGGCSVEKHEFEWHEVARREVDEVVYVNIPAPPREIVESLSRYDKVRGVHFEDWLADGSILVKSRLDQTDQIYRVASPGGTLEQLTFRDTEITGALARPGHADQFLFRSENILFARVSDAVREIASNTVLPPVFSSDGALVAWSSSDGSNQLAIWMMEMERPATKKILWRQGTIIPVCFSADGKMLLYVEVISPTSQKLYLLDTSTDAPPRVMQSTADEVVYDSSYSEKWRAHFTESGRQVILTSNKDHQFGRLVRLDVASDRYTPLGPPIPWDVELTDLSPDGKTLAFSVNEDGYSKVYLVRLADSPNVPTRVHKLPDGVVKQLRFSPDSKRLAISLTSATSPEDVWTYEPGSGSLVSWKLSGTDELNPAEFVKPMLIRFNSFDGRVVSALQYEPGVMPTRTSRLPVIIEIHGGPKDQERPEFQPEARYQYWVKLGAVVIAPNIRGSSGYGRDYLTRDRGERRVDAVRDIEALLDWIAKQPQLDPSRVVVRGSSYGGFISLWVLYRNARRLAGALSDVGMTNLVSFLQNTAEVRRGPARGEYGDERDEKQRELMNATAPLRHAREMTKPVLIIAGGKDTAVPFTEAEQLVEELQRLGRYPSYMLAKNEGHKFSRKKTRQALRAAETLWLRWVLKL